MAIILLPLTIFTKIGMPKLSIKLLMVDPLYLEISEDML